MIACGRESAVSPSQSTKRTPKRLFFNPWVQGCNTSDGVGELLGDGDGRDEPGCALLRESGWSAETAAPPPALLMLEDLHLVLLTRLAQLPVRHRAVAIWFRAPAVHRIAEPLSMRTDCLAMWLQDPTGWLVSLKLPLLRCSRRFLDSRRVPPHLSLEPLTPVDASGILLFTRLGHKCRCSERCPIMKRRILERRFGREMIEMRISTTESLYWVYPEYISQNHASNLLFGQMKARVPKTIW